MGQFFLLVAFIFGCVMAVKAIDRMEARGLFDKPTKVIIIDTACGDR